MERAGIGAGGGSDARQHNTNVSSSSSPTTTEATPHGHTSFLFFIFILIIIEWLIKSWRAHDVLLVRRKSHPCLHGLGLGLWLWPGVVPAPHRTRRRQAAGQSPKQEAQRVGIICLGFIYR